jgi:hypothetical protein
MQFLSSWTPNDKRTLLYFSKPALETFCQHVQVGDVDSEAGGFPLGSVHGSQMLIEQATVRAHPLLSPSWSKTQRMVKVSASVITPSRSVDPTKLGAIRVCSSSESPIHGSPACADFRVCLERTGLVCQGCWVIKGLQVPK